MKGALLQYLEFLKENGFLYLEEGTCDALPITRLAADGAGAESKVNGGNGEDAGTDATSADTGGDVKKGGAVASAMKGDPVRKETRREKVETPVIEQGNLSGGADGEAPEQGDLFGGAAPERPKRGESAINVGGDRPRGPELAREEKTRRLEEAKARAEACRACALGARRNKLVFSDGDADSKIAFVGEAPGADEDATGIPFIGRAGKLLTRMVEAIGFRREEVYICNTLKCRPPGNRDPLPSEKEACEHFLIEQLEIVRPQILVALGAHAAQYLCRSELSIGRLRGRWHAYHGIPLLATYHTAFLLRSPSFKPKSWDDFKMIHARYCELNPDDSRKAWSKES